MKTILSILILININIYACISFTDNSCKEVIQCLQNFESMVKTCSNIVDCDFGCKAGIQTFKICLASCSTVYCISNSNDYNWDCVDKCADLVPNQATQKIVKCAVLPCRILQNWLILGLLIAGGLIIIILICCCCCCCFCCSKRRDNRIPLIVGLNGNELSTRQIYV
jgi:hypothetical protein